jgi:small subunit ribosomal protein S16
VAVRIRMKQMGRAHRPFYRICAMDKRAPRDGRVLEELGTYDPMVTDTDARVQLNSERVDYWLGVGAQPSEKVAVLIKKYGTNGTHVEASKAAVEKLAQPASIPDRGEPVAKPDVETSESAAEAVSTDTQSAAESAVDVTPATDVEAVTDETTGEAEKEAETPADTEEKPVE